MKSINAIIRTIMISGVILTIGLFWACSVRIQDVQGLYAGVVNEPNGKPAEYFIQLYSNSQYAMRKTIYEDLIRNVSRIGSWSISGSIITLTADGEKDIRFVFERSALRIEATVGSTSTLPFDLISLHRIGP